MTDYDITYHDENYLRLSESPPRFCLRGDVQGKLQRKYDDAVKRKDADALRRVQRQILESVEAVLIFKRRGDAELEAFDDAFSKAAAVARYSPKKAERIIRKALGVLRKDNLVALHQSESERNRCPACGGHDFGPQPREMQAEHNKLTARYAAGYLADELN